jgi:tRNA(Arg) A34 adenosine deaminase TadA
MTHAKDVDYLRLTIDVASRSKDKGNHPFGAVLVDAQGQVVAEGENTVLADGGPGHAEANLARHAAREFTAEFLETCTLYTSVEPCCMCSGTIYWANIGAVVFGMSERALLKITGGNTKNLTQDLPCFVVFAAGQRKVDVRGPYEEVSAEITAQHTAFWGAAIPG